MHVRVVCPEGGYSGMKLPITMQDGSQFTCIIPDGVKPGQSFDVPIATGKPVAPSTPIYTAPARYKYGGLEHVQGDGSREGQAFSCCLLFFGMLVFVFSLILCGNVSYYWPGTVNYCYYSYWRSGCAGGIWSGWPYYRCCYSNSWLTVNPISMDELPCVVNSTTGIASPAGDGETDYWSLVVAVACGTIGSFFTMCCVAPAAIRRGGPEKMVACGNFLALCLSLASIGAMTAQLIIAKDHPFCGNSQSRCQSTSPCVSTSLSVAAYWSQDYYFQWYGNIVYTTYSLTIILAFFQLVSCLLALCAGEETSQKYSGTKRSFDDEGSGWFY